MRPQDLLTLDIEKPAAGGRMLARHDGRVVLVDGAIPGERVRVRIERTAKGMAFGRTVEVLQPSPDRRLPEVDRRCGGAAFAHVAYPRQLQMKSAIVLDAFARIAKAPLASAPDMVGSPEHGYRIRARLHVRQRRIGFYREGTHELCDAGATRQLTDGATQWIAEAGGMLERLALDELSGIELTENVDGTERVCQIDVQSAEAVERYRDLAGGLTGLSVLPADRLEPIVVSGTPAVTDVLGVSEDAPPVTFRRDVRAFFQGNRHLVTTLLHHVLERVPPGPLLDLYAGVGLFGLSHAARGADTVTLVEGDPVGGADLLRNAEPFGGRVCVAHQSVEAFLARGPWESAGATWLVDPPRTGIAREALDAIVRLHPARLVYVSCDVATLARDTRVLLDGGYRLADMTGFDMFPNTAHVELVAVFDAA